MSIAKQILNELNRGPLSIQEICEALPSLTRKQIGDVLIQQRIAGRTEKKSENGTLLYFLTQAGKTYAVPSGQKSESDPAIIPVPGARIPVSVSKKHRQRERGEPAKKSKKPLCTKKSVTSSPLSTPSFAAALTNDHRLIVIAGHHIHEFTKTETMKIADAVAKAT